VNLFASSNALYYASPGNNDHRGKATLKRLDLGASPQPFSINRQQAQ